MKGGDGSAFRMPLTFIRRTRIRVRYGGMSFVIFPANDAPCLVAMVIGTQGLASR